MGTMEPRKIFIIPEENIDAFYDDVHTACCVHSIDIPLEEVTKGYKGKYFIPHVFATEANEINVPKYLEVTPQEDLHNTQTNVFDDAKEWLKSKDAPSCFCV